MTRTTSWHSAGPGQFGCHSPRQRLREVTHVEPVRQTFCWGWRSAAWGTSTRRQDDVITYAEPVRRQGRVVYVALQRRRVPKETILLVDSYFCLGSQSAGPACTSPRGQTDYSQPSRTGDFNGTARRCRSPSCAPPSPALSLAGSTSSLPTAAIRGYHPPPTPPQDRVRWLR